MGGFGLSTSKSKQQSTSRQDASSEQDASSRAISNALSFSGIGPGATRQALAQGGGRLGNIIAQAASRGIGGDQAPLQLNRFGLQAEQEAVFGAGVSQALNRLSGSAAARGQLSTKNVGAIAGSAARGAALDLLPTISANLAARRAEPTQRALAESQIRTQGAGAIRGLLGDVSRSSSLQESRSRSRARSRARSQSTGKSSQFGLEFG